MHFPKQHFDKIKATLREEMGSKTCLKERSGKQKKKRESIHVFYE